MTDKKISQLNEQTSLTDTDELVFQRSGTAQKISYENLVDSLESELGTAVHTHAISDVTGLQAALDGKADTLHTHVIGQTTGLQTALDGKAATVHSHVINDTTGLQAALDGKAANGHTHLSADISDLETTLDSKADVVHTHVISDTTGLQAALNNKTNLGHTHLAADITDLDEFIGNVTLDGIQELSNKTLAGPAFGPYVMTLLGTAGHGGPQTTIEWAEWSLSKRYAIPRSDQDSSFMLLRGRSLGLGVPAGSIPYASAPAASVYNGNMDLLEGGAAVADKYVGWTADGLALEAKDAPGGGGGMTNPMTTTGDIIYSSDGSGTPARLAAGSNGKILQTASGLPAYTAYTMPTSAGTSGKILISDGTNIVSSTPTYPNTAGTAGKILISDGTNIVSSTPTYPNAAGTAGKILVSNGTNIVSSTPTFPNASATSGKVIKSDGTNWVASTETYAAPGTSGNVLVSNGTNWTSAALTIAQGATGQTALGSALQVLRTNAAANGTEWATADVDINGMTALTAPSLNDDFMPVYDTSATANRKTRLLDFLTCANISIIETECVSIGAATNDWSTIFSGTSATSASALAVAGHPGLVTVSMGTSASSYSGMWTTQRCVQPGSGKIRFSTVFQILNLSDATDTYVIRAGLLNVNTAGAASNGIYATYTHGTNSGKWQLLTTSSGSTTTVNGGTTVATGYVRIDIDINAAGTSLELFVNGVSQGTSSTNIPTGTPLYIGVQLYRTGGTTNVRSLNLDYIGCLHEISR